MIYIQDSELLALMHETQSPTGLKRLEEPHILTRLYTHLTRPLLFAFFTL
jgi:hypothetical protein